MAMTTKELVVRSLVYSLIAHLALFNLFTFTLSPKKLSLSPTVDFLGSFLSARDMDSRVAPVKAAWPRTDILPLFVEATASGPDLRHVLQNDKGITDPSKAIVPRKKNLKVPFVNPAEQTVPAGTLDAPNDHIPLKLPDDVLY